MYAACMHACVLCTWSLTQICVNLLATDSIYRQEFFSWHSVLSGWYIHTVSVAVGSLCANCGYKKHKVIQQKVDHSISASIVYHNLKPTAN